MKTLKNILSTANITNADLKNINLTGADPILPTPFLLGEAGAASLAAVGYISAKIWEIKTNILQTVNVSTKDAALAQRSFSYFKKLDGKTPELWSPISSLYQTKDNRWVQLHCNFPNHRDGVLKVLSCQEDKAQVAEAIKKNWQAESLETTLNNLGLCASMIRSENEWKQTGQYQAIKDLPLFEITKIADSKPIPFPKGDKPLSNINVLDLTRVIAGPVCGKTLAEHGATVMRVSSPNLPSIAPLVMDTGQGKYSTFIDLRSQQGKNTLEKLITDADVFSQAYRPGGLSQLGFSESDLIKMKPGIIYNTLSAYSHIGPWCNRHGYDSLVQCVTGIANEQGSTESPKHLPAQSLDYLTGFISAFATMVALYRRAIEGGSYRVRVSLVQTANWLQSLGRAYDFSQQPIPNNNDIKDLLTQANTKFGKLEYLLPVLKMSETQPEYVFPSVPLGTHAPIWPK